MINIFKWQEKQLRKISEQNFMMAVMGKNVMAFAIGSIFTIELVKYGFFILIAATILLINYVGRVFSVWHRNEKPSLGLNYAGYIGSVLLALYFGIQLSFAPYKQIIFIVGFALSIPALINIFNVKT